ncbi:hypothetical protein EDD85DRAFT_961003 [Armillaria nabsnona]|nr:hypothetical protein EDD85DRAFT_961003 [Armillaria nabsnona]
MSSQRTTLLKHPYRRPWIWIHADELTISGWNSIVPIWVDNWETASPYSVQFFSSRIIQIHDTFTAIGYLLSVIHHGDSVDEIMDTMILYMSLCIVVATVLDLEGDAGSDLGPSMFQVTWVLPTAKIKASASTALVPVSSEKGSTSSAGILFSGGTVAGVSEGTVFMLKKTVVIEFKIFFGCSIAVKSFSPRFNAKTSLKNIRKAQLVKLWLNCSILRQSSILSSSAEGYNTHWQDWGHCTETLPMIA